MADLRPLPSDTRIAKAEDIDQCYEAVELTAHELNRSNESLDDLNTMLKQVNTQLDEYKSKASKAKRLMNELRVKL